jgi:hypothetical protein
LQANLTEALENAKNLKQKKIKELDSLMNENRSDKSAADLNQDGDLND